MKRGFLFCYYAYFHGAAVTFGIESANVVGYQTVTNGAYGFNFVAPTFLSVGANGTSIQDIRMSVDEDVITGSDELQILDEGGATLETYVWYPASWSGLEKDGWLAEDGTLADVTVGAGKSVLINVQQDDTPITVSGEVKYSKSELDGVTGFNFVGNNTPVPLSVQDIKITVAEDVITGSDELQILDAGGATVNTYVWYPAVWSGLEKDGWLAEDGTLLNMELAPGMGVLINLQQDSTITISGVN